MMNSNLLSLVKSAINLFDPAACMQMDYEAQVATVTELVADFQRQNPALAMELDPRTLANILERATENHLEVVDVLNQFAEEKAVAA